MILNFGKLCDDLLVIPLKDKVLDISWALNTDLIYDYLSQNEIVKIFNLHDNINFIIQIDNSESFDSINLKEYNFNQLNQKYIGNIVFSAIIDFNKDQFQETTYYMRIKVDETVQNYVTNNNEIIELSIINDWSNTLKFTLDKDYTKDLVDYMYSLVADFNAYNKEVNSANFYYLFQAFANTLNKEFRFAKDTKNSFFINKSLPDDLYDVFGILFKFTNIENLSMEEYRRILKNLILGYQHGGSWFYIKNTLKYLIGYTPKLLNFSKFYPWILRKNSVKDPEQFSDRNYYNPESNYYLFKSDFNKAENNNKIMLIGNRFKKFTFIVKSENFFNRNIDFEKIKNILDILKPAYTKYILNLDTELIIEHKPLLADDETIIWSDKDNNEYLSY